MPTFPVVTCNDDFLTSATNVPRIVRRRWRVVGRPIPQRTLAVLVQEAKNTRLAERLQGPGLPHAHLYAVRQYLNSPAMAGVAVVWDMTQARPAGKAKHDPRKLGHGIAPICRPRGTRMLTRYVVWQDVEVGAPGSGRLVRLASYHRPPARFRHLWAESDDNLAEWVAESPIPVVLGSDTNTPQFRRLARRLGFRAARGVGIDCLMVRGRVLFASMATRMAKGSSDHHPVRALIRVRRRKDR